MARFTARKAWAGLALYVLACDYLLIRFGRETMSAQYLLWAKDPVKRFAAGAVTGYLVCHLYNRPKHLIAYDPLTLLAARLRGLDKRLIDLSMSEGPVSVVVLPTEGFHVDV